MLQSRYVVSLGAKDEATPPRVDRLGVPSGDTRVTLIGLHDQAFEGELLERIDKLYKRPVPDADIVFFRPTSVKELTKLRRLRTQLAPSGTIWVLREKGKAATVRETDVRDAARAAGLVDVKAVAFSETLTADKLEVATAGR